MEPLEISSFIHDEASLTIENNNYGVQPKYRESQFTFKPIDLFKIHHGDNKNRISSMSLKCMEYYLDMDIDVFGFKTTKEFTEQECEELKKYCFHDIEATYKMYLLTIGDTENPVYKENNQIQIRLDIQQEYNIPCLNYSDSKIGDEIIKKFYCEEKGITYSELPKKGTFRKEVKLKHCVPSYVKFETEQLYRILEEIKTTTLKQDESYNKKFKFFNETYTLAKGGLHSASENKQYHSDDEYVIIDADVSGYYVVTCIERGYYPYHLGKEFLKGYRKIYDERIRLKPLSKNDKKIKGVVQGLKNAGVSIFGKSSDMQSWLYDKQMTLQICITGELTLLMLIEQQELAGNSCIMANTDGATFIVKRTEVDKFYEICNNWCKLTTYELEYVNFKSLWFSNVNNYIGLKENGEVKKKGDAFLTDYEIFKDKSYRIIPLALESYFINNTPVEEFITNHKNIYDFCSRGKVSRNFYIKTYNEDTKQETEYNKLIRYYVSLEGEKMYKMKSEFCDTRAAKESQINAGLWKNTVINTVDNIEYHLSNINHKFYIEKAKEIIFKIENGRVAKKQKFQNENQLNLF